MLRSCSSYPQRRSINLASGAKSSVAAPPSPIYQMYVAHNHQFLWASAMLQGRGAESLELSIQERITWKARDRELVSSHLIRVHAALDKPPSGKSGEQHATPLDGSDPDLLALTATRQALRAQMCLTRPGRVVDLPKRRC